jgi:exonuclease III
MQITEEESADIICIQEPYIIQNKVVGIPKKYRTYTIAKTRSRAAIVVTNNHIDVLLLKQLSGADTVVVEITIDGVKLILASMYFDIGRQIEVDLSKIEVVPQHAYEARVLLAKVDLSRIEAVPQHANEARVLLAIHSNARSASWHDTKTNARGRTLDEYLMSKQLYILNEESLNTTFQNRRGVSNIHPTIITNQLLRTVTQWAISDQESSSDHKIIKYVIGQGDSNRENVNFQNVRYLFKKENYA